MNTQQFKLLLDSELSKFKETTLEVELFAARLNVAVLEGAYEARQDETLETSKPVVETPTRRHDRKVKSVDARMTKPADSERRVTVTIPNGKTFTRRVGVLTPEQMAEKNERMRKFREAGGYGTFTCDVCGENRIKNNPSQHRCTEEQRVTCYRFIGARRQWLRSKAGIGKTEKDYPYTYKEYAKLYEAKFKRGSYADREEA